MAPDLNSLPPSRSRALSGSPTMTRTISNSGELTSLRGQSPSPSPRSASTSLAAAAAVNAGLHEESRRSSISSSTRNRQPSHTGRRRSTILMNLQLNDPTLPPPGEIVTGEGQTPLYRTASPQPIPPSPIMTIDPQHFRTASLGEIHQELEQEQEAQVNRLLQMIRTQQQQLQQLQATSGITHGTPPVIDESTPTSERSMSFSNIHNITGSTSTPRSPSTVLHPRSSFDLARADLHRRSRTPSRAASPRLRSTSISGEGEPFNLAGRDESAFYQAETQMMVRENQMLRLRIRELERQVSELHANSSVTHEPATPSHLLRSESVSEEHLPLVPERPAETVGEAKEE